MNEQVKKLAEQAGFCHDVNHGIYLCAPKHMQEFAELIILECAKRTEELGQPEIGRGLMKHFGVE